MDQIRIFNDDINLKILILMRRIRDIETRISTEYYKNEMRCPVHLSVGQECPSAALSLLVKKNDYSVSTHRGHAHYLAKGGDLKKMIAEIYGKRSGCSLGKGGSMHLIDNSVGFMGTSAIVGNSIPTGTGLAHAAKLNKQNQISVIHIGDGATEQGSFYESLNYASLHSLPALYFCENNLYSVNSRLDVRQPKGRNLGEIANALGVENFHDSGKNFIETYQTLKRAFNQCRDESKPVFIEFKTFRWLEHCGPNPDENLRGTDEFLYWKSIDPLSMAEKSLSKKQIDIYEKAVDEIKIEINEAFSFAKESLPPSQDSAYTQIYSSEK
tara:strand:+ start:1857 stop:2834 length:978 start_codon:yes stop_codon:yes gene_type:complete